MHRIKVEKPFLYLIRQLVGDPDLYFVEYQNESNDKFQDDLNSESNNKSQEYLSGESQDDKSQDDLSSEFVLTNIDPRAKFIIQCKKFIDRIDTAPSQSSSISIYVECISYVTNSIDNVKNVEPVIVAILNSIIRHCRFVQLYEPYKVLTEKVTSIGRNLYEDIHGEFSVENGKIVYNCIDMKEQIENCISEIESLTLALPSFTGKNYKLILKEEEGTVLLEI